MALVAYSDSEGSDNEAPVASKPNDSKPKPADGAAFRKVEPRKIKVDLPAVKPEVEDAEADRPAKRARTGGGFSGFNSLLPAPKRPAGNAPGRGVSLKTSSEAAFSRQPVNGSVNETPEDETYAGGRDEGLNGSTTEYIPAPPQPEAKPVGKATKFKPLSVQSGQKKKKKLSPQKPSEGDDTRPAPEDSKAPWTADSRDEAVKARTAPPPKPKRSLFSVLQAEESEIAPQTTANSYEAITTQSASGPEDQRPEAQQPQQSTPAPAPSNNLSSLASDLNLSNAERRRLFGSHAKGGDINIAHFNMDAEYASNEQLRQAGEVVEHKAVKSIAPGKHSLQQLVNNARSQQENLEDKWAEGRRERGEGQGKYGWGR
ncbi:uncharacterized protein LTR77_001597 [Saxophila tyrrhenica]|uniref:Mitotic checkpoint regulator, MAD2B-interacting-domain-containing protein n=1 Tax=Saxophila tyrrhenica TaxID=1690608 RepID=A0AAV9PQC8_9PEZI|nr:hypothetical protein LTR77_001597 [Saxophila tyrrhenica]